MQRLCVLAGESSIGAAFRRVWFDIEKIDANYVH